MSLPRIPVIFSVGLGNQIAWTSPNPPPPQKEGIKFSGTEWFTQKAFKWGPVFVKGLVWTGSFCEIAVILAHQYVPTEYRGIVLSALVLGGTAENVRLTRLSLAGWFLATSGSFIRRECYRSLNRMFTYELCIRDKHELVTNGPYAFVRHPGYTGALLVTAGTMLCHLSKGSWLRECGVWDTTVAKGVVGVWVAWMTYGMIGLVSRTGTEDEVLKEEFGDEWIRYAKRVRYRMIPGIY